MPCEAPIPAYRPAIGGPLKFSYPKDGRAYTPIQIPCATCILCREEQARQWAVRITHEAQAYIENSFVTLSYSDEHLRNTGASTTNIYRNSGNAFANASARCVITPSENMEIKAFGRTITRSFLIAHSPLIESSYKQNRTYSGRAPCSSKYGDSDRCASAP